MTQFKTLFIALFLSQATFLAAQSVDLQLFNKNRVDFNKRAMTVLGGWAVGNMIVSGAMLGRTEGSSKAFHQMNLGWNAVNLGIAALGYWGAVRENPAAMDGFQTLKAHMSNEKAFLFNTGLDVGYMAGGLWLVEKGKNATKNAERFDGFGKAMAMNGAFLFVFDLTAFLLQNSKFDQLKPLVRENGVGLSWVF
jgi:hypothetical protein